MAIFAIFFLGLGIAFTPLAFFIPAACSEVAGFVMGVVAAEALQSFLLVLATHSYSWRFSEKSSDLEEDLISEALQEGARNDRDD